MFRERDGHTISNFVARYEDAEAAASISSGLVGELTCDRYGPLAPSLTLWEGTNPDGFPPSSGGSLAANQVSTVQSM